ncbi:MAG: 50S ribosomal protein L11 methyltransferase [Myxococcales bacterium]|nr:50S ribosomal protein L11 methyltransferase [Myxococcales bacterium]
MGDWVEVVVHVGAADVDDIAALIASEISYASAGTEQRGDEVVFWVDRADSAAALIATSEAVARWQANGASVSPQRVKLSEALPEEQWRDAWKKYFKVTRITRQFVVVPSWERHVAHDSEVVIDLDPGMAFGTGTHASTRLVMEELQELADAEVSPSRVLDVGCGSGILAIAAVKRWPEATCLALDNDPLCIDATLDNASTNRVADRIAAELTPVGELTEEFPLVLANIQAHVLRALMPALVARLAPGGTLILSGLLTPQAQPLADEFVAAGLRLVRVRPSADDPQWSSVTLRR